MHNDLSILSFIAIYLIKDGITGNSLSDKISCIYYPKSNNLVCGLMLQKNATVSPRMKIYINYHSNKISSSDFSKFEKGRCSTNKRSSNSCTFFPKKQEFRLTLHFCDSLRPFYVMVVKNNEKHNFSITPCKHERIIYQVNFVQNGTYMGFLWRFGKHVLPSNDYYNSTYEYSIFCQPLDTKHAKTFERKFKLIPDKIKMYKLNALGNLTSGTKYRCITNARYKKMLNCGKKMFCKSEWLEESKKKNIVFHTRNEAPSRGPLWNDGMFQVDDGVCYVYFLPVPVEYRNGDIRGYQCNVDNDQIIKIKRFVFKMECSNIGSSCDLYAINNHGRGSVSTHVNINRKNIAIATELELWRTSYSNMFKVRWKLSANVNVTKAFILICKCSRCNVKHPDCISMRSQPVLENQIISVDFNSERTSLVVESPKHTLLMSEWVKCSYSDSSEAIDITRIIDEVREHWKREPEGNRTFIHITIPTDMLQCGSQHYSVRPINNIYVKRICPKKEDFVRNYVRHVGNETVNIDVEVFQDCDVLLSVDGRKYVSITKNKEVQLWVSIIVAILIIIIIIIIVCTRKRIRRVFRSIFNQCRKWKSRNFGDEFIAQKTMQSMKYTSRLTEEGYEVIEQVENRNCSTDEGCRYPTPLNEVDNIESLDLKTNGNDGDNFDIMYTSQSCELKPISEN